MPVGVEGRVGDRRGGGGHHFLARTRRGLIEALDDDRDDLRAVGETRHRISAPVEAGHAGLAEPDTSNSIRLTVWTKLPR